MKKFSGLYRICHTANRFFTGEVMIFERLTSTRLSSGACKVVRCILSKIFVTSPPPFLGKLENFKIPKPASSLAIALFTPALALSMDPRPLPHDQHDQIGEYKHDSHKQGLNTCRWLQEGERYIYLHSSNGTVFSQPLAPVPSDPFASVISSNNHEPRQSVDWTNCTIVCLIKFFLDPERDSKKISSWVFSLGIHIIDTPLKLGQKGFGIV